MDELNNPALQQLRRKIEELISRYETVCRENSALSRELESYKTENKHKQDKIDELEERIDKLQLTEAFKTSATDVKEARRHIERLVREINKCIALLHE